MKREELASILRGLRNGKPLGKGAPSGYVVQSIETGRSSYTVTQLLAYCEGCNLQMAINDWATDENFSVNSALEAHQLLDLLIGRYQVSRKTIYAKTGITYTPPRKRKGDGECVTHLSIQTLLGVLSVMHCELRFFPKVMKAVSND